jgi:adenosine deaminase
MEALYNNSITELHKIPKSDLHNHAGRGGNLKYIAAWANVKIDPPTKPFESLYQMQQWFEKNVKCHCAGNQGYLKRHRTTLLYKRQSMKQSAGART